MGLRGQIRVFWAMIWVFLARILASETSILELGHIAWIWAIMENLGQNAPQRRWSPEDEEGGLDGWILNYFTQGFIIRHDKNKTKQHSKHYEKFCLQNNLSYLLNKSFFNIVEVEMQIPEEDLFLSVCSNGHPSWPLLW